MRGEGGGRPPKPDGQKVNRNATTKPEIVLPAEGRTAPVPTAPLPLKRKAAKEQWERLWRTPESLTWSEADLVSIARMVILQTDPATLADTKLLSQVAALEDRFLLNPNSRRINKVSIAPQDGDRAMPAATSSDMKKRLRVVGDS